MSIPTIEKRRQYDRRVLKGILESYRGRKRHEQWMEQAEQV